MDVIKNILGTPTKMGGRNDWDGDGVRNKKDCQPRNTMRQDDFNVGDAVIYKGKKRTIMSKFGAPGDKMLIYGLDGDQAANPRELKRA